MKKGIILYQSKYGATKKYAEWLREETSFDCLETAKASGGSVAPYEIIVLCGGVYASGIAGLSFLKRNRHVLKGKQIAVFCVGASPYNEEAVANAKKHSLRGEWENVPLFYGRGAWEEGKMTTLDKTLCKMLQKSVAKKDPDTYEPWMKALTEAAGHSCDWTDKTYLTPLLDYLAGC